MKILSVFIAKAFIFLFITFELCIAKEVQEYESNKILKIFVGYPIGSNDWGYTHPFVGSEVTHYETETGTFKSKLIINGQFEISNKYFGLSVGTGFFPADIKVDKTEELYSINSIFAEIEGLFFPFKSSIGKIVPILRVGGGGVVLSGDLKTTALFYSIGAGFYTFITKNIGASVIIKNRYFTYDEIPLDENITGDIKTSGVSLQLGLIYSI